MTSFLERAGFALVLLWGFVAANSVAIALNNRANAAAGVTALSSLRDGAVPSPPFGLQSTFAGVSK